MSKLYKPLILLVMVGMASAAVYEMTPSDAKLFFSREIPQYPEMHTLIEYGPGFTTRYDMGEMSGNTLNKRILNMNPNNITVFEGCVYFEINCSTGMNDTADGIEDFISINYTCPNGTEYSCNDHAVIGRVSPTSITITPPMEPYPYPPDMIEIYSEIEIVFVNGAYGDYELTVWTDQPPG